MDKIIFIVCTLLSVIQTAMCQPHLAALLGLGGFGDISESQTPGSGSCPYKAHADRRKFSQMVNNRLMTQECAPGTMFVLSKCSCDNIPTGGGAGGPMPGSNPRHESALRGSGNALLGSLLSQLQGGAFPSSPTRAPPPPVRNRSPMNTNQLNAVRQKVTSGVRPDQNGRENVAGNELGPQPANSAGMQYNPDPRTGLTSVVDPSVLADVLPREILHVLEQSNKAKDPSRKSSQTGVTSAQAGASMLPESVQRMLDRASKPPTARPDSSSSKIEIAQQPGSLPSEVLKMLQQSIKPPTDAGRTRNTNTLAQGARSSPSGQPRSSRISNQSPSRSPSPTRKSSPSGKDPVANIMAELQRSQKRGTQDKAPSSGPREDPLAALLAGVSRGATRSPSSRGITRGPSRVPTRAPPRAPTGAPPGGDPLAALLGGIGGGSGLSLPGGGGDPLAALMAGGGSSGAAGNSGLAALLGGSSGGLGGLGAAGGSLGSLGNTAALARNIDLTNFFNAQGLAGGTPSLAGLNNINFARLQQLDTYGIIDVGDLTPAGLIAANAHFSG